MSMMDSTCVTVTGHEFCNVTVTWTPRVSEIGGLFAMILPALYAVLMFVGLCIWLSRRYSTSFWEGIKRTYTRQARLVRVKKFNITYHRPGPSASVTEYGEVKKIIKDRKSAVKEAKVYSSFYIDGEASTLPVEGKKYEKLVKDEEKLTVRGTDRFGPFEEDVRLTEIKRSKDQRKILCGAVTLPLPCGVLAIIIKLLIIPLFAIAWDLIDIIFDTYYFYELERGGLIDPIIFRNTHVNNSILAFACLGAVKSTLFAFFYLYVVGYNRREGENRGDVMVVTMVAVSFKWTCSNLVGGFVSLPKWAIISFLQ